MIEVRDIRKSYRTGDFVQRALDGVSIAFRDNEFVAVLGPSGSGKTTFLNVLGGLDHADSGDILVNGVSTKRYRDADWDTYRNHHIGFVFQSYNLIPHQSVLSNVELALTLSGVDATERRERAAAALARVGLAEHADKRPAQLSGGQMQRVAIARALVNDPDIVLADEPTGALDGKTGVQIMDLLREVANDRLVIMVTHNPELAAEYATRTVRLADGRITDDSMPFSPADDADDDATTTEKGREPVEQAAGETANLTIRGDGAKGKASMSFATALELSFNNLMTKKGRTFLTAFAGSIGIIGIAAILALSNGVNAYIEKSEKDAMSSYPLSINQSSSDFMSRMVEMGTGSGSGKAADDNPKDSDPIPVDTMVSDMFATIKSNDLGSFKSYLDGNGGGIDEHVSAISYGYGITPHFYNSDPSKGTAELGSPMGTQSGSTMDAFSSLGMGSSTSSFQELVDNDALLDSQYDVLAGRWPKAYDECVMVLGHNGKLTDYTLYALGLLDQRKFDEMIESVSQDKKVEAPKNDIRLTYDNALKMSFTVVEQPNLYKRAEGGTWTDMSGDADFMSAAIDNGIKVRVVGVVRPNSQTSSSPLVEGVAYTPALTTKLIEDASGSDIAKQQKANPKVDVFTGKTFDELQKGASSAFDMGSIFSVDADALRRAFSFDASRLQASAPDLSTLSIDTSKLGFDASKIELDPSALSGVIGQDTILKMLAGAPKPDLDGMGSLDEKDRAAVQELLTQIGQGFLPWWYERHPGESISPDTDFSKDLQEYLASKEVAQKIDQIQKILGDAFGGSADELARKYLEEQLAPYLEQQMSALVNQAAQVMAQQLSAQLQAQMSAAGGELASQLSTQIAQGMQSSMTGMASNLQGAFSVDADAFRSAIHFNLTQADLQSLMTNFAQASQLTYDNNLKKIGCADLDKPTQIKIYPKDFDSKEHVLEVIDGYNDKMEAEGKKDQAISYSDVMGSLLSSVTSIVNMISVVLIAFVSISLVVSSIMIGIITYISVLERKKEIGILRAMGASKRNVANVFNAETFIEGLMAGVFAIAAVELVSLPVNAVVLSTYDVPDIMQLSPVAAIVLILISVVLTVVAGIIPASKASRRDPVEALRSE